MNRFHELSRSMSKVLIACLALGVWTNEARAVGHAGPHGAGAGHLPAYPGGYGHGYRGYYGGYGFYGYPYGYYGFGLGFGYGFGYGYGYPSYGYPYYGSGSPYYGGYFGPDYLNGMGYSGPNPALAAGSPPPNGNFPASSPSTLLLGSSGAPLPPLRSPDTDVTLIVRVPPSATVWINGAKTTQNGPRREFTSTGMTLGRSYTFFVRAQWTEPNGAVVDTDRQLTVLAGERRAVDFGTTPPAGDAKPAPVLVKP